MKKWLLNIIPKRFRNVHKYDKVYHAVYGYIFFLILTLFFENWIALILTVALGFLIEVSDKRKGGKFDIWDAIATFTIPIVLTIIMTI